MSRGRGRGGAAATIGLLLLGGCVTEETSRSAPQVLLPGAERTDRSGTGSAADRTPSRRGPGVRNADGSTRTIAPLPGFEDFEGPLGRRIPVFTATIRAEVQPRGALAYDEQSLPLVSPDGTRIAVQSGLPPTWATLLAEDEAMPPDGGVAIHDVSSVAAESPRLAARVLEPVVLGRAVDDDGFLVESVRPDGSRWIGRADWGSGAIQWLVTGEGGVVNAFATLGPDGWMAWSRRRPGQADFSLVVRSGETGEEWELPSRSGAWVMPRFALDGSLGLFTFIIRGELMDLVHLDASAGPGMTTTLRRTPIATGGADVATAYQAVAADAAVVSPGLPPALAGGALYFVHPASRRAAVWRPDRPLPDLLDAGSVAAVGAPDNPDYCLVSLRDVLVRRAIDERRDRIRVIAGVHIARPTTDPDRPFVLFQPSGSVLGVTMLRFAPVGDVLGEP